jgi:adenosylmethionine-8-amino-7-oxononanoate aminotransferase
MNLRQRDRKFLARESAPEEMQVRRTAGSFVFDARGKKYIDFLAGWCVGNFGWGARHLRPHPTKGSVDYAYPDYLYEPWVELAELLAELTPGKLQKSFRATGGSEAVEIALQIAMAYTKRRKFVSIEGAYHGNTIGAVSVGSSEERETYPNLLRNCAKLRPPLNARAAARLEQVLERRDVAALIMEPISCNLGVMIPDDDFMNTAAALCRSHGTLFIADEVATGFGRTGKLFASEHFGLEPDILCMAKAITGGLAPLGATITSAKIANALQGGAGFYSTYGWHPHSVSVAIANLTWLKKNSGRVLRHVETLSEHFRTRLSEMRLATPSSVRIRGLAIALETGSEKDAGAIAERCRKNGLLLTTAGTSITMFPALTMDLATAEAGLEILARSIGSRGAVVQ